MSDVNLKFSATNAEESPTELRSEAGDSAPKKSLLEAPVLIHAGMLAPPRKAPEQRCDFEHGISYWQPVTLSIIAILIAMFSFEIVSGALSGPEEIIAAGALKRENVLHGEIWRLLSAVFLHGSVDHLIGNCLALYVLGMAVEHAFSRGQLLLVFLGSGFAGSLLSLASSEGPSVGASGAIFGLAGSLIVFFYRYRKQIYFREKRLGGVLVFWAAYTIFIGFISPMIDNWAHIGGFLGGMVCTFFLRPSLRFVNRSTRE